MGFLDNIQAVFGNKKAEEKVTGIPAVPKAVAQKKVLIVEDEDLLANALALKFTHENFAVFRAGNGQQGLEMTATNKPDIILLDLMMPIMDGKTMLHQLRQIQEFQFLPVIVLTNAGEVDNIRQTKRYDNASAFLIKSSVTPEDIVKVVKETLGMATII